MNPFPEHLYPPDPEHADAYYERVARGYVAMGSSVVTVCGLARQLGDRVHRTCQALDAVGRPFACADLVVYENDSADGTAAALLNWQSSAYGACKTVVSERLGKRKWPPTRETARTHDMAFYRNRLRDLVLEHCPGNDFVVVLDLDLGLFSLDGLADTFGRDGWDAVASNGLMLHHGRVIQYDAFAWRNPGRYEPLTADAVNPRVLRRGAPLVPVASAFGGMAVYTGEAFAKNRYEGGDCEHVAFHRGMDRVFVNPSQIVLYD